MLDLRIEQLRLNITNAAGHEHRLQPITLHALSLLAEALDERRWSAQQASVDRLDTPAVSLDLNRMSDTEAAQTLAEAWLSALALKIGP